MSAGYVSAVPLGVPALIMSDGSLGITQPRLPRGRQIRAAGIELQSATRARGAEADAGGCEARSRGFNVQLAGVSSDARPADGWYLRDLSEDPWHSAVLAAETINGIQSEGVISTIKHYTPQRQRDQPSPANVCICICCTARVETCLAFQIAIQCSQPAAIMCGYNKVNGEADCGNNHLLNDVLKKETGATRAG